MKTTLMLLAASSLMLAGCGRGTPSAPAPIALPKIIEAERFVLKDSQGRVLAMLDNAGGQPILGMLDKDGKLRIQITLSPEGEPFTVFSGKDGKPVFTAPK